MEGPGEEGSRRRSRPRGLRRRQLHHLQPRHVRRGLLRRDPAPGPGCDPRGGCLQAHRRARQRHDRRQDPHDRQPHRRPPPHQRRRGRRVPEDPQGCRRGPQGPRLLSRLIPRGFGVDVRRRAVVSFVVDGSQMGAMMRRIHAWRERRRV